MSELAGTMSKTIALMCSDGSLRRTLLEHCSGVDPTSDHARFNTRIHPDDQMLTHSLAHHGNANAAFSQYFSIALQQHRSFREIRRLLFAEDAGSDFEILDFACGFGRMLRFLALSLSPQQIWASELQADALAFVGENFGVHTLASHADPSRFVPDRRFDMIWVASLFSHLPETLFHAWLARLTSLLKPDGVLCFSVRDVSQLPAATQLPANGFLYDRSSENASLDGEIYGTAWASEAFVTRAVHAATGDQRTPYRLPRALANEQDIYVVAADPYRNLSVLGGFRRGPWGWLDQASVSESGQLHLQGWAASLDDGEIDHVEIEFDGATNKIQTGIARPDVVAAFDDKRMARAGWEFRCNLDQRVAPGKLAISAHSKGGETALIHLGLIGKIAPTN
jgi:SAM-dependent methyltransferase